MKKTVSGNTHTKQQLDNYSSQNNPNSDLCKANINNRANQLNPNNPKYHLSRMNDKNGNN